MSSDSGMGGPLPTAGGDAQPATGSESSAAFGCRCDGNPAGGCCAYPDCQAAPPTTKELLGPVLGYCPHGVDLDREFCPEGCRV